MTTTSLGRRDASAPIRDDRQEETEVANKGRVVVEDAAGVDGQMTEPSEGNINRRSVLLTGTALAASGLLPAAKSGAAPAQAAGATKPNIVFILTDNLGYGELGVYGGGILRGAPTPNRRRNALAQLQR